MGLVGMRLVGMHTDILCAVSTLASPAASLLAAILSSLPLAFRLRIFFKVLLTPTIALTQLSLFSGRNIGIRKFIPIHNNDAQRDRDGVLGDCFQPVGFDFA